METFLHIGGLVAAGFDPTGAYLLAISHSGRGVFSTKTWTKVARDGELAYPISGIGVGIGPIDGQRIAVSEMPFEIGRFILVSANGNITLVCESDGISVHVADS